MNLRAFPSLLHCGIALFVTLSQADDTGTARRVIYLNMLGGMSQWESFDPKPGNGPAGLTETPVDRLQISGWLPKSGKIMDRCLVLRSVRSGFDHVPENSQYVRLTGYTRRATVTHPDIGSWVKYHSPNRGPWFRIHSDVKTGSGFLPAETCGPIVIPTPQSVQSISGDRSLWEKRNELASAFSHLSVASLHSDGDSSRAATRFLASEVGLTSLDWKEEAAGVQQAYGDHNFGKSCLLARRLAENADACFIEVGLDGWEAEGVDYFENTRKLCAQLDDGFSALIADLEKRNMLEETLVIISTEIGRTEAITDKRRKFQLSHSCAVLAGGGIRKGIVIGETGPRGRATGKAISPGAFNAIIAKALRIDPFETVYSPSRRPFVIGKDAKPEGIFQEVFGKD